MKRSVLTYCILSLFAILGFSACDVHEFPDMPERRPYELVLDFTNAIDMGFYQTIDYSRASTEASPSGTKTQTEITYDIRYTVNAYRIDGNDGNRLSDTTVVVCNSDLENLNHTLRPTFAQANTASSYGQTTWSTARKPTSITTRQTSRR